MGAHCLPPSPHLLKITCDFAAFCPQKQFSRLTGLLQTSKMSSPTKAKKENVENISLTIKCKNNTLLYKTEFYR